MLVLVSVKLRAPIRDAPRFETALPSRARTYGRRVDAATLAQAFSNAATMTIHCDTCSWDYRVMLKTIGKMCKRRRVA